DGTAWHQLAPVGVGDGVASLAVYNGELVATGRFNSAGNGPANFIARWNGSSWQLLGNGLTGPISAFTEYAGDLLAATSYPPGVFTVVPSGGWVARGDGASWQPLGSAMDGSLSAVAVHGGMAFAAA